MTRRRFLRICASVSALPVLVPASTVASPHLYRWTGIAMGSRAEILLRHTDRKKADRIFRMIGSEINRLEDIFSMYRHNSELVNLNRTGSLPYPSQNMVELLELAGSLHQITNSAFDPTIQPLWKHYAAINSNPEPKPGNNERKLESIITHRMGFDHVNISPRQVEYSKPGMEMTLNGIAQGYITDKVAELLKNEGFENVLVDIGEIAALGSESLLPNHNNNGWEITVRPDPKSPNQGSKLSLLDTAVASSARFGTTFDLEGRNSHILNPVTGEYTKSDLSAVSVVTESAAIADALSTAAIVSGKSELIHALKQFSQTTAFAVTVDGRSEWLKV